MEPEVVLAASPRDWAQRLQQHVADFGGARVRATVLHPGDALSESCDVFVADDVTSFLTRRLVGELQGLGRRVLGVYDPRDAHGKDELIALDVDAVIERDAAPDQFVTAIAALFAEAGGGLVAKPVTAPATATPWKAALAGHVTAVGGPLGGPGATEVAIGLAVAAARRGDSTVVVDGDDCAPSIAQRLGLPLYPNVRAAVDVLERDSGRLTDSLSATAGAPVAVLTGLAQPADWAEIRAAQTVAVIRRLASMRHHVVVNVGPQLEDLGAFGAPARFGQARAIVAAADAIIGVGLPTPVGLGRMLDWVADVRSIAEHTPVHLVVNKTPPGAFQKAEALRELERTAEPTSLRFVPFDRRVPAAAWAGTVVAHGPFTRAMADLARDVLPAFRRAARRRGAVLEASSP